MPDRTHVRNKPKKRNRRLHLSFVSFAGLTVLLVVVIVGFISLNAKGKEALPASDQTSSGNPASTWDQMVQVATKQVRYFKGAPDAPVTILEFSDFQ